MIRLVDVHFRADETSGTFEIDAVNVPPAFPGSMQEGHLALAIKSSTDATAAERLAELEDAMARVLRYNANILSPQPGRESNVDDTEQPSLGAQAAIDDERGYDADTSGRGLQPKLGKLADLPPDSPVGDDGGLLAIIAEARHQGKHIWNRYTGVCFAPDELERQNANGKFRWGSVNWELVDPGTKKGYFDTSKTPGGEDADTGENVPTEDVVDGLAALLRTLANVDGSFSSDRALFPAKIQDAVNFKDIPKHQNAGCGLLLKTVAGDYEISIRRASRE